MADRGVNKAIIVGRLGQDPDTRYTAGGGAVSNVSIATSDTWKDKQSGETQERTEWHRVVFFGRLAEIVEEYLKKGSQVYVEGRIQTRKWQDKEGRDRYTTEIVANEMQMLGGRGDSSQGASRPGTNESYAPNKPQQNRDDNTPPMGGDEEFDDIPF